ncbi:hypothetical protein LBMAG52_41690 [Planctomycetia bacterium]|nr:hypothetical protein LBMAG52_41690 [Planctomycetia bacterium]
MAKLFKRTFWAVDPITGERVQRKTPNWYGKYCDDLGIWRRVPLCPNKTLAGLMLAELKRKTMQCQAGVSDPFEAHRKQPLALHVAQYRKHLQAKRNSADHVARTIQRIESVNDGCGFRRIADLKPAAVASWLAEQREPTKDTDGNTIPGLSVASSNHYLTAIKGFARWLVRDRRSAENPLVHLSRLNGEDDIRCSRRSLSETEFGRLLKAARDGKSVCGLTGVERELLYLVAAFTGLRARELSSLTESSFDLTANPPTMTVEAGYSKRRRRDTLPVHPLVAETLATLFAQRRRERDSAPIALKFDAARKKIPVGQRGEKPNAEPIWSGTWAKNRHGAEMIRHDLQTAGLSFEDERGDVFDFHSLRGQFITQLGRSGVSLVEAQKLARHCDPKLTANHYTHLSLHDLTSAVSRLAAPRQPHQERETMTATGADDFTGPPTGPKLAQKPEYRGEALTTAASSSDANRAAEHPSPEMRKPRINRGSEHVCESWTMPEKKSAEGGSRTHTPVRIRDFESRASAIPPLRPVAGATS